MHPQANLNLWLVVLTALFSFTPILTVIDRRSPPVIDTIFDPATYKKEVTIIQYSVCIVLIPAADLLLDYVSTLFRRAVAMEKPISSGAVVRLTDAERLLFIIGVALQSSKYFLDTTRDLYTISLINGCLDNTIAFILLAPIIMFLGRCTSIFTTARTHTIIVNMVLGILFRTFGRYMRYDAVSFRTLNYVGTFFLLSACLIYGFLILLCMRSYFQQHFSVKMNVQSFITWLFQPLLKKRTDNDQHPEMTKDLDKELYTNYIPALHIASSCTIIVATSIFHFQPNVAYLIIFAEVTVLVIELRIRKNEIARALMALLQTKKSYVRYISHELRTPLNTAFLGLKLLTSELKASKSPDDIARYDTLCDVNMSCTAALDILNDLLCYEKLESGRMDLHAENVCVLSFLSDCLSLFSAESRERGIRISLLSDPDRSVQPSPFFSDGACGLTTALSDKGADTGTSRGSSIRSDQQLGSLYASDTVLIDRFKMDQVVRNLISNALKFTDLGGEVTVAVSFLSDVQAISTSSNISLQAPFDAIEIEGEREGEGDVQNQVDLSATAKINSGVIEDYASHSEIKNWQCCKKQSYAKSHTLRKTCIKTKSPITETDSVNGKLVLIITDTGAGISDENQKRLFKEIVQFNPEKLQSGGGSGLGLWITAGILDLHSGSIRVHSDGEGQGTSFIVELPMTRHSSVTADSVTPHALTPPSTATTAVTPIRLHHLHHHHHHDEHKNEDENEKENEDENENENETRERPVLVDLEENFLSDSILPYQRGLVGRNSGSSLTHGQPGLPGQSGSDNLSVTNHTPSHTNDKSVKSEGASVRRILLPVNASTVSSEEKSLLFSTLHLKNSKYSPADNSLRNIEITSRNSVLEKDGKKDLIVRERKMKEDGAKEEKTSGEVEKVREIKSSGIKTAKAVEKKEVTNTNTIEMVYADEGATGSSVAARHYNILVVDDSRLNRKMLLKCLRTAGHTCVEGEDGSEALALVKERMSSAKSAGHRFDAILMDFVMPIMDGPTATKEIRALGYSAPIFGVTGNGLISDVQYFRRCGADDVFLKPFDITYFNNAMSKLKFHKAVMPASTSED